MLIDADAEIPRLRAVLRDLVALSTIPLAWIGREPPAVAAGLADTLIGLIQLDFAFVRLCDPGGDGAVDVTRGSAWPAFPSGWNVTWRRPGGSRAVRSSPTSAAAWSHAGA